MPDRKHDWFAPAVVGGMVTERIEITLGRDDASGEVILEGSMAEFEPIMRGTLKEA
ncbi:MAG: hypothetical protein U0841_04265 [Chloroflexia bacterium]